MRRLRIFDVGRRFARVPTPKHMHPSEKFATAPTAATAPMTSISGQKL
jgi:hypothetical protein